MVSFQRGAIDQPKGAVDDAWSVELTGRSIAPGTVPNVHHFRFFYACARFVRVATYVSTGMYGYTDGTTQRGSFFLKNKNVG